MKRIIIFLSIALFFIACNSDTKPAEEPGADTSKVAETPAPLAAPSVTLPYTAGYSAQWTDDVSDNDLLTVLNSYKYWESGDMAGIKTTLADSVEFNGWDGTQYKGLNTGLLKMWTTSRDSMSSVKITIDVWRKMHSVDKKEDYISVWYKEIDTYKTGKVDSAYFQDDNGVKNGKINWYSQHKQYLKKKK